MKVCTRCKRELPLDTFGKRTRNSDGRADACRDCVNSYNRAYYLAHRDARDAANRRWIRRHLEHRRELGRQAQRRYDARLKQRSEVGA